MNRVIAALVEALNIPTPPAAYIRVCDCLLAASAQRMPVLDDESNDRCNACGQDIRSYEVINDPRLVTIRDAQGPLRVAASALRRVPPPARPE